MAVRKRGNLWQMDVTLNGIRHRESFKTKKAAIERGSQLVTRLNPPKPVRPSAKRSGQLRPSSTQTPSGTTAAKSPVTSLFGGVIMRAATSRHRKPLHS
jgi:hypothetical protein